MSLNRGVLIFAVAGFVVTFAALRIWGPFPAWLPFVIIGIGSAIVVRARREGSDTEGGTSWKFGTAKTIPQRRD